MPLILFFAASPLTSFADGDVTVNLVANKVVTDAKGKEVLEGAEKTKPGDVIQYTAVYRNKGAAAVKNLQATVPIPTNTEFLAGSGAPTGALASADRVHFTAMPLKREVKLPDGKTELEAVPLSEYRALRWSVENLAPGQEVKVSVRVKVSSTEEAAPKQ